MRVVLSCGTAESHELKDKTLNTSRSCLVQYTSETATMSQCCSIDDSGSLIRMPSCRTPTNSSGHVGLFRSSAEEDPGLLLCGTTRAELAAGWVPKAEK